MNLSPHFTLLELTESDYADRKGIDNTPTGEALDNLAMVAQKLEMVRKYLHDLPIFITSGYRGPTLNKAIGGSKSSAHLTGLAADFKCPNYGDPYAICKKLETYKDILQYDQLIREYGWVHIGFVELGKTPRLMELTKRSADSPYIAGIHE